MSRHFKAIFNDGFSPRKGSIWLYQWEKFFLFNRYIVLIIFLRNSLIINKYLNWRFLSQLPSYSHQYDIFWKMTTLELNH